MKELEVCGLYPLVRTWTCGFAADHGHVTLDEAIIIYDQDEDIQTRSEIQRPSGKYWDRALVSFIMTPSRGFGPRRIPLVFVEIVCIDFKIYLNELVAVC